MPGSPTPPLIQIAWANGASPSYVNTIPLTAPTSPAYAASYQLGFPPITMTAQSAGGLNPDGRDFNGILNPITANLAALTGGQGYQFNSTYATANGGYALGAILAMSNGAGYWINQVSGNSNNPDTTAAASSGWSPLIAYGVTAVTGLTNANVTLTAPQAAMPVITLAGTLTGNVQIIFPTWTKRWQVVNNTTGAFSVTCITAAGTGVIIPQGSQYWPIVGDGTNILSEFVQSGSFTATGVGFTTSPTGTVYFSITGNQITLYTGNDFALLSGTSNNSIVTLSGLPSYLIPARFQGGFLCIYGGVNNGSPVWTSASIDPQGVITFGVLSSFGGGVGQWTPSGAKSCPAFSFTYSLT